MGNQPPSKMPDLINCADLIILPSKNEGLPRITIEALACGKKVVGSRVGGIPESIGIEYTIPLSDNFVPEFAELSVQILKSPRKQQLPIEFINNDSCEKEIEIFNKVLKNN